MKQFTISAGLAALILSRQCKAPVCNAMHLPAAWRNYVRYASTRN